MTKLPVTPTSPTGSANDVLGLARSLKLTTYDALYVLIALEQDAALATLDRGLRRAARELDLAVV